MRRFLIACLFFWPGVLAAQDSLFTSYEDYETYVNKHMMSRDFIPLILRMGGRDEHTQEQLAGFQRQFDGIYRRDFENTAFFKKVKLSEQFEQEARVFWVNPTTYIYYYALLHHRGTEVVVMEFLINSSPKPILDRF